MSEKNNKNILYCSFCGKSQHEVRILIAGPTVFICDECVELCMDIIKEENKSSLVKHQDGVPSPKEICNVLDEYVIGQKFANVDAPITGRKRHGGSTNNTSISSSGYYQMHDTKVGLKSGSQADADMVYKNASNSNNVFFMPSPYQGGYTSQGAM